jgi:hypothetical protein
VAVHLVYFDERFDESIVGSTNLKREKMTLFLAKKTASGQGKAGGRFFSKKALDRQSNA